MTSARRLKLAELRLVKPMVLLCRFTNHHKILRFFNYLRQSTTLTTPKETSAFISAWTNSSRSNPSQFVINHYKEDVASSIRTGRPIASLHLHWWPVGQGLYSSGLIRTKNGGAFSWVYDCGTSSKEPLIVNALNLDRTERASISVNKIDLVVLSHFDHDHISGFLMLIATNPIKYLLIPYVPLWERLVLAVEQGVSAADSTFEFFLNPVAYLRGVGGANIENIVFVPTSEPGDETSAPDDPEPPILPEGEEDELMWPSVGEFHTEIGDIPTEAVGDPAVEKDDKGKKPLFLKPGGRIVVPSFWEFVPYNDAERKCQADARFINLAKPLLERVKNDHANRDQAFKDLKKLYIETFGSDPEDKNIISLFLYSGPISRRLQLDTVLTSHLVEHPAITTRYAQIHTGDGTLTGIHYTQFESFFKRSKRLQKLGLFQVMHHGSKKQWHAGIAAKLSPTASIFSSNPEHKGYKHPNPEVLRDFWRYHPIQVDMVTGFHLLGDLILT